MKIVFRLLAAVLLVCLTAPSPVQAGGDAGKNPYEIGEKYFARKDYRTALKLYRKALSQNDARAHYRLGLIYEATGKNKDALKHYRLSLDPGQPDAQRNDTVLRIKALEARPKKTPRRPPDLLERGRGLFLKGEYREAERVLLQAAAQDESKPQIHFYLGEVYLALEEYDKAKAEYAKAKKYY